MASPFDCLELLPTAELEGRIRSFRLCLFRGGRFGGFAKYPSFFAK
jgi:hypothetical protein